jgi:hypothetical protein
MSHSSGIRERGTVGDFLLQNIADQIFVCFRQIAAARSEPCVRPW